MFRKPAKNPIEIAIGMISHAVTIIYGYKHNTRYTPNDYDLKMIDIFTEELWEKLLCRQTYTTVTA